VLILSPNFQVRPENTVSTGSLTILS
jgi:hypothetical protein